jgi:hypothetical protein
MVQNNFLLLSPAILMQKVVFLKQQAAKEETEKL